jgi:hypothetical protein
MYISANMKKIIAFSINVFTEVFGLRLSHFDNESKLPHFLLSFLVSNEVGIKSELKDQIGIED